jgi:Mor family transcriptional regulator
MLQADKILKRNKQIYKKRLKGATYSDIAKHYSISPQRVRQIFDKMKHGLSQTIFQKTC